MNFLRIILRWWKVAGTGGWRRAGAVNEPKAISAKTWRFGQIIGRIERFPVTPALSLGERGNGRPVFWLATRRGKKHAEGHNPVGVEGTYGADTQGSSFPATLGWRTQARWGWGRFRATETQGCRQAHHDSKVPGWPIPGQSRSAGQPARRRCLRVFATILLAGSLTGCHGTVQPAEGTARKQLATVASAYRPNDQRPALPVLTTNSTLADLLTFALLNHPQVASAYYDWVASVNDITVARSLPDPQIIFQMDIANAVTSVMPGLLQTFPAKGRLKAQAGVAAAESKAKETAYEAAVLQTAYGVKQSYYQLWYLDETLRVDREMQRLLARLEEIARAQNASGQVTLQDVYRAQIEEDRLASEIANLEDSRSALMMQFQGALGLAHEHAAPPWPVRFAGPSPALSVNELLATAFARNPQLAAMRADITRAQASMALAESAGRPETSAGLMVDARTAPVLFRPLGSVSLPVWQDKLQAEQAAAQAGQEAAAAGLAGAQISLMVTFAEKSYEYREISRKIAVLGQQLIPKTQRSLEIARSAYLDGKTDFFNLMDTERSLLNEQSDLIAARLQRELMLAELSLLIAGVPPERTMLLPEPHMH